jgi:hypothetical protein
LEERKQKSFVIFEHHLSALVDLPVPEEKYKFIQLARQTLNEANEFEERFWAVCELYREFQDACLVVASRQTIYFGHDELDIMRVRSSLSVKLSSFISAARFYLDLAGKSVITISRGGIQSSDVMAVCSEIFDNHFEYRLLYQLRNYVQHYSLPVHGMSMQRSRDESGKWLEHSVNLTIPIAELISWSGLKSSVKKELRDIPTEKIDLSLYSKTYFSLICQIHDKFRAMVAPNEAEMANALADARVRWINVSKNENPVALSVGEVDENGLLVRGAAVISLAVPDDRFTKMIKEETRFLMNVVQRRVKH